MHREFGGEHAERALLESFEGEIRPSDILFVNLEPCCHQGKQPPCTDILLERGVRRVCIGMRDPDERVAGQGIARLRDAGVDVIGPVAQASCERLNRGFVSVRTKHRPWITLKRAQTKDGRIAHDDGSTLKITSPEQDAWSHGFLRAKHDAILVGVETIVRDDPTLDARLFGSHYQPWRIVLDPHLRIPLTAKVVSDEKRTETLIVTSLERGESGEAIELQGRGVRVFPVATGEQGFDLESLWDVLIQPAEDYYGLTSILVEGGARTWQFFRDAGVMDEEVVLMGGR
jgi:diaminohydroxyphosphoribosylaminopyrimidine deaminase/5-amino-6-(5-phosphoribosylamino)uracil reductase